MGESLDLYFYLTHENIFLIDFIEIIFAIFYILNIYYLYLNVVLLVFINLYLNEFDFSLSVICRNFLLVLGSWRDKNNLLCCVA